MSDTATQKRQEFHVGDVVRTRYTNLYPHGLAVVWADLIYGVVVTDGKTVAVYEHADVAPVGRIVLGEPFDDGDARGRQCFYVDAAQRECVIGVRIRASGATEELDDRTTQVHAFLLLRDDGTITAAPCERTIGAL